MDDEALFFRLRETWQMCADTGRFTKASPDGEAMLQRILCDPVDLPRNEPRDFLARQNARDQKLEDEGTVFFRPFADRLFRGRFMSYFPSKDESDDESDDNDATTCADVLLGLIWNGLTRERFVVSINGKDAFAVEASPGERFPALKSTFSWMLPAINSDLAIRMEDERREGRECGNGDYLVRNMSVVKCFLPARCKKALARRMWITPPFASCLFQHGSDVRRVCMTGYGASVCSADSNMYRNLILSPRTGHLPILET